MSDNNQPKRYEIKSFKDLINVVTPENFENLSTDLLQWLMYSMLTINEIRKTDPEKFKDLTNWEISECHFEWIDDGKNDLVDVKLKDLNTGEVETIYSDKP